jgi:hypothetical protein
VLDIDTGKAAILASVVSSVAAFTVYAKQRVAAIDSRVGVPPSG